MSHLIHSIYKASYTPEHWEYVLSETAKFIGANSMTMLYQDKVLRQASAIHTFNISDETKKDYLGYYCTLDPSYELSSALVDTGVAIADHQMIPNREDFKHRYKEFYEYMVRHDHLYLCGANLIDDEHAIAAVSGQRGKNEGPWPQDSIDKLTDLAPHFQQALHIYQEFTHLNLKESTLKSALNNVSLGVVLIDNDSQVVYTNQAAKALFDSNGTLTIINQRIITTNSSDTQRLRDAFETALKISENDDDDRTTVLGIKQPNRSRPLSLLVMPLEREGSHLAFGFPESYAAVFVSDPDHCNNMPLAALHNIFSLTKNEAEVAISIANGYSVAKTSEARGVTTETVKSQLKSIYTKLGIQKQTELVRIVFTIPFGNIGSTDR